MRPSLSSTRTSSPAPATSPPPAGTISQLGHPYLEFLVTAGLENERRKAQPGGTLPPGPAIPPRESPGGGRRLADLRYVPDGATLGSPSRGSDRHAARRLHGYQR